MKKWFLTVLTIAALIANTVIFTLPANAALQEKESNEYFTSANKVGAGQSITGKLKNGSDKDYFEFTAKSDGLMSIDFVHVHSTSGANWHVRLYLSEKADKYENIGGEEGYLILRPSQAERTNILTSGVNAGDKVYVFIESYSSSVPDVSYTLEYDFTESDSYEKEFNNSFKTATVLKPDTPVTANLSCRHDEDYFLFNPKKSGSYEFVFSHEYSSEDYLWRIAAFKYEDNDYKKVDLDSAIKTDFIRSTNAERITALSFYANAGDRYYLKIHLTVFDGQTPTIPYPVRFYDIECVTESDEGIPTSPPSSSSRVYEEDYTTIFANTAYYDDDDLIEVGIDNNSNDDTTTRKTGSTPTSKPASKPTSKPAASKPANTNKPTETLTDEYDEYTASDDEFYDEDYDYSEDGPDEEYEYDNEDFDDEFFEEEDYYDDSTPSRNIVITVSVSAGVVILAIALALILLRKKR